LSLTLLLQATKIVEKMTTKSFEVVCTILLSLIQKDNAILKNKMVYSKCLLIILHILKLGLPWPASVAWW
jgi:hypothetical protein